MGSWGTGGVLLSPSRSFSRQLGVQEWIGLLVGGARRRGLGWCYPSTLIDRGGTLDVGTLPVSTGL